MDMAHPLTIYRKRRSLTLEAFAAIVGTNKSVVSKWERGAVPRRAYCERILTATGGEVTPSHFVLAKPQSHGAAA